MLSIKTKCLSADNRIVSTPVLPVRHFGSTLTHAQTVLGFIIWNTIRSLLEALIQASAVWSAVDLFFPMSWTNVFWIFAAIQFLAFFAIIFTRLPGMNTAMVRASTVIHAGVVFVSLVQALVSAIIPAILALVIVNLIAPWTGKPTDWLHPSIFFASLFFILYHHNNRKKALEAWYGASIDPEQTLKKAEKKKDYAFGQQSPDLLQWQCDTLAEHRRVRERASQAGDPSKIIWTRAGDGVAVTELGTYWAQVTVWAGEKFAFIAYSKDSGVIASSWFDYETEQAAMHAAVDFMQDRKDPRTRV